MTGFGHRGGGSIPAAPGSGAASGSDADCCGGLMSARLLKTLSGRPAGPAWSAAPIGDIGAVLDPVAGGLGTVALASSGRRPGAVFDGIRGSPTQATAPALAWVLSASGATSRQTRFQTFGSDFLVGGLPRPPTSPVAAIAAAISCHPHRFLREPETGVRGASTATDKWRHAPYGGWPALPGLFALASHRSCPEAHAPRSEWDAVFLRSALPLRWHGAGATPR
jgi:hypothetical protein